MMSRRESLIGIFASFAISMMPLIAAALAR